MSRLLVLLGLVVFGLAVSQVWLEVSMGGASRSLTLAQVYNQLFDALSESAQETLWGQLMYYSLGLLPVAALVSAIGLLFRRAAVPGGVLLVLASTLWLAGVYLMSREAPEGATVSMGIGPFMALVGGFVVAAGGSGGGGRSQRRQAATVRPARRAGRGGRSYVEHYHHYDERYYDSGYYGGEPGRGGEEESGEERKKPGEGLGKVAAAGAVGAAAGYAAARLLDEEDEGERRELSGVGGFVEEEGGGEEGELRSVGDMLQAEDSGGEGFGGIGEALEEDAEEETGGEDYEDDNDYDDGE